MVQNVTDLDQWNSRAEADLSTDTDAVIDALAARTPWQIGISTSSAAFPLGAEWLRRQCRFR
ncbi:hypothetical protein EN35_16490 [Rhodococcus qingshengii]|nr:hypothetical protein EN35_16490 [Rhodococcus qingshengii]